MSPDHREIALDRGGAIEDPRGQICRGFDEIAVVSIAPPETTTKVFRQRPKSVLLDDDGDIEKDDDDDD